MNKKNAKQNAANELCVQLGLKSELSLSDSGIFDGFLCSSLNDLSLNTPEKTPVTMLQEFCAKNKIVAPYFEELAGESSLLSKNFKCKAAVLYQGESKEAIGTGLSKKSAKHSAARCLLELLGLKFDWTTSEVDHDTVSTLQQMCVARNYCTPAYEDIQVTGPSHCPEFTLRCTVASLVREAKAPTKKLAKQMVAKEIIQFIQDSPRAVLEELQIATKAPEFYIEEEIHLNNVADFTYRQYKNSSNKKPTKLDFSERHEFFVSHLDAILLDNARREFISTKHETLREKVEMTLKKAGLKFKVRPVPSVAKQMYAFELDHESYDCYLVAFEDELWSQLADYFIVMLNIPISLSETLENLL